jgi:hypothetical protein
MITKTFRAQSTNSLRQENIFRDHGRVAASWTTQKPHFTLLAPQGLQMIMPGILDGGERVKGAR